MNEVIKVVMLAGVGNNDIRRKILRMDYILSMTSYEIISLIGSKKMGLHATKNSQTVSAIFSFQHQNKWNKSYMFLECNTLFYSSNKKGTQNTTCLVCAINQRRLMLINNI